MEDPVQARPPLPSLDDPRNYLNRELEALSFQSRVFEEAQDERNPLLERIKFIAIIGSNLDEFFMVRVGGLSAPSISKLDADFSIEDESPEAQLVSIRTQAQKLMGEVNEYWRAVLIPLLHEAGIHIYDYNELDPAQQQFADRYFDNFIFPVLTPLAFDPGHPFPHISNLSLNLAILVKGNDDQVHFARLKIPDSLPYLVAIDGGNDAPKMPGHFDFVWVSQVIRANLKDLFPGMEVLEAQPFYVNRNAELEIGDLEHLDLMETMEESVRKRRFSPVVRLLVDQRMPRHILDILIDNLKINEEDIYAVRGPLVLRSLMHLYRLDRPDLKYRPFIASIPDALRPEGESLNEDIFSAIRRGDILLHHPYDSFNPVIAFLTAAARDPNVLAIKQTLYRVGSNSPVVKTLLEASRDYGKQVAVLVELKARFDEESNIGWARMLEQEGVHVTYGVLGLKTHSKVALVVRMEEGRIRRYMHLATGNYNHVTAQLYEDIGLFTCDDDIGIDVTDLFNYLTGYSQKGDYRKLLVAPVALRSRLETLVTQEIDHQATGEQGHIIIKVNALVDKPMIRLLYLASQAGVKIDLIIRGACSLRPGIPRLSENIRVISILGRFLEHSRIFYFRNAGQERIFLGRRGSHAAQPQPAGGSALPGRRPQSGTPYSRRSPGDLPVR